MKVWILYEHLSGAYGADDEINVIGVYPTREAAEEAKPPAHPSWPYKVAESELH